MSSDFNDLPAHVWPRNAVRQEDGVVTVAGVPLPEIAEEYGTPVFVVDEDDFRSRCQDMARAFGGPENVHYASKAFLTRTIARWVDEEGLSLDVASLNARAEHADGASMRFSADARLAIGTLADLSGELTRLDGGFAATLDSLNIRQQGVAATLSAPV